MTAHCHGSAFQSCPTARVGDDPVATPRRPCRLVQASKPMPALVTFVRSDYRGHCMASVGDVPELKKEREIP